MSEHASDPGPQNDKQDPKAAQLDQEAARAKQDKARAEAEAKQAEQRAEKVEASQAKESKAATEPKAESKEAKAPESKAEANDEATEPKAETKDEAKESKLEVVDKPIVPKIKPELDETVTEGLVARSEKKARTPRFRRHEWWRYKKLGGKNAPWRRPRGIHSKQRRHFKYRPPVVSIGYRGPRIARGLHPSGFEEVLVYRPEDLEVIDPKIQAARVGGTVGGRKAELIEAEADKRGIRVLNRRNA